MTSVVDKVDHLTEVYSAEALSNSQHLAKKIDGRNNAWEFFQSPLVGDNVSKDIFGGSGALPEDNFLNDDLFVTAEKEYNSYQDITQSLKFVKAGPRKQLFCDPSKTKVAIVTCGGLCPGLNVVIRELVMCLHYNYEV